MSCLSSFSAVACRPTYIVTRQCRPICLLDRVMRAAHGVTAPRGIRHERDARRTAPPGHAHVCRRRDPRAGPGSGKVLIEVRAAGVCLSDVHLIDGSISPFHPAGAVTKARALTLGHEGAGVVHALGPDVKGAWTRAGTASAEAPCARRR
ncbi:alcohol dehydrogenase catalytic domain-containing protein [Streptomyces sp. NPDC058486]|uniref:alcohol dehydrogenase catalytic domain-containing protein n=1 Tax=unclassified Streptomyces TaxID=2593676 RepID=UPI00364AA57C